MRPAPRGARGCGLLHGGLPCGTAARAPGGRETRAGRRSGAGAGAGARWRAEEGGAGERGAVRLGWAESEARAQVGGLRGDAACAGGLARWSGPGKRGRPRWEREKGGKEAGLAQREKRGGRLRWPKEERERKREGGKRGKGKERKGKEISRRFPGNFQTSEIKSKTSIRDKMQSVDRKGARWNRIPLRKS